MKKRFISILLTVVMVMSLFTGLSVNTYAETAANAAQSAQTIEYTMAEGDFVLRICQRLGLNYYTCKPAIMILNNINEGQWNKLAVGRTLILPASDYDAALIANGGAIAGAQTGAQQVVQQSASTSTVTTAVQRDTIAYYLVPYTMSYGDTVSGVCSNLGVNFNIFQSFIAQVNGVSSWSKVKAGDTLLIPTPVQPGVGTSCYAVMSHKVAANETAYSIANANGLNYNSSKYMLGVLNQTNNLANISANSNFFYPVATTILYPGTGASPSSSTTTVTTVSQDGNTTTTTTTVTSSKLYKLTTSLSSSDGTMTFFVANKPVNEARAGDVVTIVNETEKNKAIESLTVKHLDGSGELLLKGDSFIMPNADVRVDAVIKSGHEITLETNYSGKTAATVGGVSVSSAVKGAVVTVVSTDPSYEIESIYAYYKKFSFLSTKTPLSITSNSFVMPDMAVTIEVKLKPVTTYAFYTETPAGGRFFLQVNGGQVTRAAKGANVTIVPKANDGYVPAGVRVTKHGDPTKPVNVFNNTFTMPGFDVDVHVIFTGKGNNIILLPAEGGTVSADIIAPAWRVDYGVTEANTGDIVQLVATPSSSDSFFVRFEVVRNSDGLMVNVTDITESTDDPPITTGNFIMPEGGVTVTTVFVGMDGTITSEYYIDGNPTPVGSYQGVSTYISFTDPLSTTGAAVHGELRWTDASTTDSDVLKSYYNGYIPGGTYVNLRYDCAEGLAFVKYIIEVDGYFDEELTNEANFHGYFRMPEDGGAITLKAYFERGKIAIGTAAVTGTGTVSYLVMGSTGLVSANTANPGDLVYINLTPGEGYLFDYKLQNKSGGKLLVTRKDNGAPVPLIYPTPGDPESVPGVDAKGKIIGYRYAFYMPPEGVNVQVIFDPRPYKLIMKCQDEAGNDLTGKGFWQVAINGEPGVVDNEAFFPVTLADVNYGDSVIVAMTEAGYSKYDIVSFKINGYEYVADVLNYFYNFSMVEDRARDLEIVATLRPKVPYDAVFHKLNTYYDTTKGSVEFLLDHSVTGYSNDYLSDIDWTALTIHTIDKTRYVPAAFAGDKVVMLVRSTNYKVTEKNVTITGGDADRIVPLLVPGPWTVDGVTDPTLTVLTFTMPETDVFIQVDFVGNESQLEISVKNKDGMPVGGMIRASFDGLTTYRDVAADSTFGHIEYGKLIYLMLTEEAIVQNKKIASFLITPAFGDPVPYYDFGGIGYQFTMPNAPVTVNIVIDENSFNIALPLMSNAVNGSLIFRDAATGGKILTEAKPGTDVYVFATPNAGYAPLEASELTVLGPNGANIAEWDSANNCWHFVMPQGGVMASATFSAAAMEITFLISGGTAQIASTINGMNVTRPISDGDVINVTKGQVIYIAPDEGYTWDTKGLVTTYSTGALYKTGDIVSYTVPDLSASGNKDTLALFLKEKKPAPPASCEIVANIPNCTIVIKEGSAVLSNPVDVGKNITITVRTKAGYKFKSIDVTNMGDGSAISPDTSSDTEMVYSALTEAGGIAVAAVTEPVTIEATLKITGISGGKVGVLVNDKGLAQLGDGGKFQFKYGDAVTIGPAGETTWDGTPTCTGGECELKSGILHFTSDGSANPEISIKLQAKS